MNHQNNVLNSNRICSLKKAKKIKLLEKSKHDRFMCGKITQKVSVWPNFLRP